MELLAQKYSIIEAKKLQLWNIFIAQKYSIIEAKKLQLWNIFIAQKYSIIEAKSFNYEVFLNPKVLLRL